PGDGLWAVGRDEALRFDPGNASGCASTVFADTLWGANIVFSHEGIVRPDRTVVLCSHYDAHNSGDPDAAPGADDNASGTAAVLEAARALRGASLERTVEFVFFDGEEIGLLGSRRYVAELPPADPGIDGVINLDMIGRDYGGGVRVEVSGRESSPDTSLAGLVIDTAALLDLDLDPAFLTGRSPTSDHKPFWDLDGVPAILLIEGAYWDNPHYHDASDVASYCDFDFITEIARAAAVSAARLAGLISPDPLPGDVVLHQNFPNPLWGDTRIRFELPARAMTEMAVYDAAGRRVRTLMRQAAGPGPGEYAWDGTDDAGKDLASGVYFLRLRSGGAERSRKLVILR
ncbi:MAG: M20/M25/M40 family metallo-hydrolase, partial [Candidatus Krumholzibacteria bacterium]|nr:M20/M25/M40 family metallo-hydrolase [Candidatus Krumholzibacteria bacterium]